MEPWHKNVHESECHVTLIAFYWLLIFIIVLLNLIKDWISESFFVLVPEHVSVKGHIAFKSRADIDLGRVKVLITDYIHEIFDIIANLELIVAH